VSRLPGAPLVAGLAAAALTFGAVALATDGDEQAAERSSESAARAAGRGSEVFVRLGCGSCHHLSAAGSSGQVGPDLDAELPDHTRASLTAKILAPGQASLMPQDFGSRTTDAELRALVEFLLQASPS
jgi:mono/diheme cytochrome c family protein